MAEKKDHFRAPIQDTFRRKSPFGQLLEHMCKVKECIDILGHGLIRYYKGDYKGFPEIAKKVSEIEHEADFIKSNIATVITHAVSEEEWCINYCSGVDTTAGE